MNASPSGGNFPSREQRCAPSGAFRCVNPLNHWAFEPCHRVRLDLCMIKHTFKLSVPGEEIMTKEIDHSLNGCQRDIYELRRELRNERQVCAESSARLNAIIEQCEATIAELRAVKV